MSLCRLVSGMGALLSFVLLLCFAAAAEGAVATDMLHNSVNTASTYWGGWGVEGGKYGAFTCTTCHIRSGPNAKQVVGAFSIPNLPGNGQAILFSSTVHGSSDFGNDEGGHGSSNRICEVCHSLTAYHRYDSAGLSDLSHYNQTDCVICHKHRQAFKAACDDCHGNPPTAGTLGGTSGLANDPTVTGSGSAGAHAMHVAVEGYGCLACHNGYKGALQMPKGGNLNIGFNGAGAVGGTYNGRIGGKGYTAGASTVVNPTGAMTCTNLYCHGSTLGATVTADWDGGTGGACGNCHGASAAAPPANPASGRSHLTHAGSAAVAIYRGGSAVQLPCAACHGGGYSAGTAAPDGHVDGAVGYNVAVLDAGNRENPAAAVSYNGNQVGFLANPAPSSSYQTCANVNCHWGTTTPAWNADLGAAPGKCVRCHNDGAGTTLRDAAPASGAHAAHLANTLMVNNYVTNSSVCGACHGNNADSATHGGHINFSTTFGNKMTSYNPANQTCVNACHYSDTTATKWAPTGTIQCDDCHRYNTAAGAEYMGPTVVDPGGTGGAARGMAAVGYGSHLRASKTVNAENPAFSGTTNWDAQCKKCHPYHSGGVTVPLPPANWTASAGITSPLFGSNMRTRLGIAYTVTGGIHLGGSVAAGSSEAEMCWGCHGSNPANNEWGYNIDNDGDTWPDYNGDTAGTGTAFVLRTSPGLTAQATIKAHNFGWLYAEAGHTTPIAAWVDGNGWGSYHRDAYSNIAKMSRRITSVHSGSFDPAKQVSSVKTAVNWSGTLTNKNALVPAAQEKPADIRCSYCHDLHDLNRAQVSTGVRETATGRPFLRGTWRSNPYPQDLPPESGQTNTTNFALQGPSPGTERMYAPRATSAATHKGGYFVDRNSNMTNSSHVYSAGFESTATNGVPNTAGLCVLCHGGATSAEVNALDFYSNGTANQNLWRGNNGHGFAALGGTKNANSVDLFDPSFGKAENAMFVVMGMQPWINMNFAGSPKMKIESCTSENRQFGEGTMRPPDIRQFGWIPAGGVAPIFITDGTTACTTQTVGTAAPADSWYKAGYVPAKYHYFTCSKCHTPHASGLPALLLTNCLDQNISTWGTETLRLYKQAPNCHRKQTGAAGATGTGWNVLQGGQ